VTSFPKYLSDCLPDVEGALDRLLVGSAEPPGRLHEAMRYSVFAGGKRVRPGLVILAGETFGVDRRSLLPGAAAMEMIHTFSLVHDDLPALDDDDLRRGRPTVHRQYDEALAVLVGDALLDHALLVLAREPASIAAERRCEAVALVAAAVGSQGMIGGQVHDLEAEAAWPEHPEAALKRIHALKTGALLTASIRLGGVYAGVDAATDATLTELGESLGLLFQIADDILDVEGTSETLGKTAGKDAASRKLTYPGLLGIEESRRRLLAERERAAGLAAGLPGRRDEWAALIGYLYERDR